MSAFIVHCNVYLVFHCLKPFLLEQEKAFFGTSFYDYDGSTGGLCMIQTCCTAYCTHPIHMLPESLGHENERFLYVSHISKRISSE